MKPQFLIDVVEAYKNNTSDSEFLTDLVEIFVENGMSIIDLEDCYGIDDDLDAVIDEYERADDDADEDEWPDGGREMF